MAKIDLLPSLIIEYATLYKDHHHSLSSRLRHRLCFYYCTTLLTVLLILGLNVFCVHHSTTTVNSLRLLNLRVGLNIPNLSIDINVSLSISITATTASTSAPLSSPTAARSWALPLSPRRGWGRGAVTMDVILTVYAGKLVADAQLYADVVTMKRIPRRVTELGVIKTHMVTYNTCDVIVNVRNRSVR